MTKLVPHCIGWSSVVVTVTGGNGKEDIAAAPSKSYAVLWHAACFCYRESGWLFHISGVHMGVNPDLH